ncbi:MAG: acyl-CoA synthetase [Deltaproteobacteria bacterium]|nr:MAG: acyl-CoA synthetase [Deltaproteobacteria bacterium]
MDWPPAALRASARPAVTVGDAVLSYAELSRRVDARASALARAGVRAGSRVPLVAAPTPDTVIAYLACARIGAVSVPIAPSAGAAARAHIETNAQRGALPDDAALILHTSGTTGPPKGAVITWTNITSNLDALADAWQWTGDDTVVHALPLFHVHGLVLGLFGAIARGGALRWLPRFSPAALAAAIAPGDVVFAVPTMYHRLADAAADDGEIARGLRRARLLVSGSAALPVREHQRLAALGCAVYERYGLTETLINCAVRAGGPPAPGFVGPPLGGVQLRIVEVPADADAAGDAAATPDAPAPRRPDAPPGTIGEIAVRGPNVFSGYLGDDRATAAVRDAGGWFYTGDLGARDAGGRVRVLGRRSTDLIKTGGYRVGAGEVEDALLAQPGVREAAVVGVPDADLGERIVAFVVGDGDAGRLAAAVADQIGAHKRPREVRFVAELPKNALGKVRKAALRAAARHP